MSGQQLLTQAEHIFYKLKSEKINSIISYVSFAHQVIVLLNNNQATNRDEILSYTGSFYSRNGLWRQWKTFNEVLKSTLNPKMNKNELLYLFGYLKRLLTIEGKTHRK